MADTAPTPQPDEPPAPEPLAPEPEPDAAAADPAPGIVGDPPGAPAGAPRDDGQGGVHALHVADDAPPGPRRGPRHDNLQRMLDVPLTLTVELGSTEMPLAEVLRLDAGAVVTIDRLPGEPIDLLINGRHFARGEVVVINEAFGYRITELVDDPESTLEIGRDEG